MEEIRVSEPLRLNGAKNVRDLGGYPIGAEAKAGRQEMALTVKGAFLRADGLQNLTDEDIETLVHYGVRRVIDLRSDMEVKYMPDRVGEMEYFRVAMWDQMNSSGFQGAGPESIFKLYQSLLDHFTAEIGQVMHLMAEVKDGAVLFHCTAGKDRTGVIAMLLLELAGVPDDFIIADYAVTERNMKPIFERQREQAKANGIEIQDYMFGSEPGDMRQTLNYFRQKYGNAEAYLVQNCGCCKAEIALLKVHLGVR